MEYLLFESNSNSTEGVKISLKQKYYNKLYELIKQKEGKKVIVTLMSEEEIKKCIVKIDGDFQGDFYS
jgi:hypothetical protein